MSSKLIIKVVTISMIAILLLFSSILAKPEGKKYGKTTPDLNAFRINPKTPVIDGILDDVIWQKEAVEFASGFIQTSPDEGYAITESTVVAVAYDDDAIFIAFWNYDSEPDKIKTQLVRRDRWSETDRVSVLLDPYHDHQSGNQFFLNASAVQIDRKMYNDTRIDESWDAVWEGATKIYDWGWTAEFKIPYSCLRFKEKDEHTWGLNLTRYISRKEEAAWWAFSPSTEGGRVSQFGHLHNIQNIKPARHFEVLPYTVSKLETEPNSLGNPDGRSVFGNIGVDVKYGISSNITLDATINPDFGQVELDAPVLNLSTFESYFPEKRPFFLEGAGLFDTPFSLFYSRRIGRSPREYFDDVDYYTDRPTATTILGAAKITGKVSERSSFAILNAVTQEEKADFVDVNGQALNGIVEPKANYTVVRFKQDILKSSHIGIMGTLASQDQRTPASTAGIDWNLTTNDGSYGINGQLVINSVESGNPGFGTTGTINKHAGKHVRGAIGWDIMDPNFDLNALGFSRNYSYQGGWAWMQYRTQDDWWIIRNSWHNLNYWNSFNYDGANTNQGANYNFYLDFTNYWSLGGGVGSDWDKYSDRETRGNGLWVRPKTSNWWANFRTDGRKKLSFVLNPGSGSNRNGSWWSNYIGVEFRPKTNMEFSFGVDYDRNFGQTRWVTNEEDSLTGEDVSIFADLDQDGVSGRFTSSIMLSRNLSFQLSGRLLLSGLDYQNYRRYIGNGKYAEVGDVEIENEDFNYVALNSTMIIRWEYNPGSTLYLVWTRQRNESDSHNNLDLSRDLSSAFSSGGENVFLAKISYWWNM